ncbi:uncharacterized protein LOC106013778 [Aplysia californica]|uniref:Uncharacterized protein LOC106013778 n=1 Tax=Aplysia californica TaxID=6500 RepID=A0ABM1W3X4_APLCA|nr:uncharacterized protein LOC106013778 [Aplysia californica]
MLSTQRSYGDESGSVTEDKPADREEEVILGEIEGELNLHVKVREIEMVCPGYEHCFNQTQSYNARAMSQALESERRSLVCEGSRLNILCLDDVLCGCGWGSDSVSRSTLRTLRHNHEQFCDEDLNIGYLNCNVENHRLRAGEIYCKAAIQPGPANTGLELGAEIQAQELSLAEHARNLDKACPGYERCFNVTQAYTVHAAAQNSAAEQLLISCEGSKFTVICLEDVLCACGWGDNDNFKTVLRDLRHQHEAVCNEDLTIGYLACSACSAWSSFHLTLIAVVVVGVSLLTQMRLLTSS